MITSEEVEKKEEEEHLKGALRRCGYPSWALRKKTKNKKKKTADKRKKENTYRNKVVIPYVEFVSERVDWVLTKCGVTTASSHNTETSNGTPKGQSRTRQTG